MSDSVMGDSVIDDSAARAGCRHELQPPPIGPHNSQTRQISAGPDRTSGAPHTEQVDTAGQAGLGRTGAGSSEDMRVSECELCEYMG
ncbi:MAG: hypothetical protein ACE5GA_02490 [Candidatus Zixiibacteriota bacterium]